MYLYFITREKEGDGASKCGLLEKDYFSQDELWLKRRFKVK